MSIAVEAPGGELAAAGVERQLAVDRRARAAIDEAQSFPGRKQADGLQPERDVDREATITPWQQAVRRRTADLGRARSSGHSDSKRQDARQRSILSPAHDNVNRSWQLPDGFCEGER